MTERLLFLTGHLAEPRLRRILEAIGETPFAWDIVDIGVQVAALMTEAIILRRLPRPVQATRIIFPGRAGLDPARLTAQFDVPFERGPDELADLPAYLGRDGAPLDLSKHDVRIFAEIVDAPLLPWDRLLARAETLRAQGVDVIDIGCRPGTRFDHLETTVTGLLDAGFRVSVDSGNRDELRRGALAGANFLLSLTEETLDVADGTDAIPVLVPAKQGDLDSLIRAADKAQARGLPCMLDPVLDPIHFGFTASLMRYATLRARLPEAEILMGTGNLTELTDADSSGVTAILMGICSELAIRNVLVVQVSKHTRETVAEHDFARRLMYAARTNADLPRGYGTNLLQAHDRKPFVQTADDLAVQAQAVRDPNYRIATAEDGIHVFNNTIHEIGREAMALYPALDVATDGAHAFYLGTELMKAETAFALGKRYVQDTRLDWGCAAPHHKAAPTSLAEAGHTLRSKKASRDDP